MQHILEIAQNYRVPLTKLRKLHRDGFLRNVEVHQSPILLRAEMYLGKHRQLPVEHLIFFYKNPSEIDNLSLENQKSAREQVQALGDVASEAFPADAVTASIYGAFISDAQFLQRAAEWASDVIPAQGCGYHYLATRWMHNVPDRAFKEYYAFIGRAVTNLRRYSAFSPFVGGKMRSGLRFKRP